MPDDFVFIQAEVSPGATTFAVGDTVTIDTSETYTVIMADNQTFQDGLDGTSSNSANGMLFCARNLRWQIIVLQQMVKQQCKIHL